MCTLTVIPLDDGYRLVHSRDELRTRPEGDHPRWASLPSGRRAIWPTDPEAGGTWIAAREDGVTAAILNVNIDEPHPFRTAVWPARDALADERQAVARLRAAGAVTRGRRVLDELDAFDWPRVDDDGLTASADRSRMMPHRLVVVGPTTDDPADWRLLEWTQRPGVESRREVVRPEPACFVSSGLGDSRVRPRRDLFREMVAVAPTPDAQDAFHRHAWPDRPEISVLMSRDDARTVGITTVEVRRARGEGDPPEVSVSYDPIEDLVARP